jgi:hypothetical protein
MRRIPLRLFQLVLTAVILLGLAQSVLFVVRPQLAVETTRRLIEASAGGGVRVGGAGQGAVPLVARSVLSALGGLIALLLLWRIPHRRDARMLALLLACGSAPVGLAAYLGAPVRVCVLLPRVIGWLRAAAFVRFAALFPHPLTPERLAAARRSRPLARLRQALAARLLRPGVVWTVAALGAAVTVAEGLAGVSTVVALLWVVLYLQGVGFLLAGYRTAERADRRQIMWVLQGFNGAVWIVLLSAGAMMVIMVQAMRRAQHLADFVLPLSAISTFMTGIVVGGGVILLSLALAIFYEGALDPSLVIRKTTVYGALTLCAAFLFAVLEQFASTFIQDWLHLSSNITSGVAGALVGMSLGPLRDRIARAVERRIPVRDASAAGPPPDRAASPREERA